MKAHMGVRRLSRSEAIQVTRTALDNILPQTMAAVLYVLDQRHWHKENVKKFYDDVVAVYRMPAVMGRHVSGEEMRDYIGHKYGIDFSELTQAAQIADDEGNVV